MKRAARRLVKSLLLPVDTMKNVGRSAGVLFLVYHKVDGIYDLELNLRYPLFRRQMAYLAASGRVVDYNSALALLNSATPFAQDRYVLTFDDGYEDFYTHVLPLLLEFRLPATLFVTTGFVDTGTPYPLQSLHLAPAPLSWPMLEEICASGLVTIGGHTHTHSRLPGMPAIHMEEEFRRCNSLLERRLGIVPQHFAYPTAVWDELSETVVKRYYSSAVIGNGRIVRPHRFDPYRIDRVAIRKSDGWFFFLCKLHGWLENEERLYAFLRRSFLYRQYVNSLRRDLNRDRPM